MSEWSESLRILSSWEEVDETQFTNFVRSNKDLKPVYNLKTSAQIKPLIITFIPKNLEKSSQGNEENSENVEKYETIFGIESITIKSNAKFVECTVDSDTYLGTSKSLSNDKSSQFHEILIEQPKSKTETPKTDNGFDAAFLALKEEDKMMKKEGSDEGENEKFKNSIQFKKEISLKILSFLPKGNWNCSKFEINGFCSKKVMKKSVLKEGDASEKEKKQESMFLMLASSLLMPKTKTLNINDLNPTQNPQIPSLNHENTTNIQENHEKSRKNPKNDENQTQIFQKSESETAFQPEISNIIQKNEPKIDSIPATSQFDISSLISFAMSKFVSEMNSLETRITNKMNEKFESLEKRIDVLEKKLNQSNSPQSKES